IPRFTFEKFPDADSTLTSAMKSVGEAMAIGRTFKESLQKALRSLETGARGFGGGGKYGLDTPPDEKTIRARLATPNSERIYYIRYAFMSGMTVDDIFDLSKIDPWFLHPLREIYEMEVELKQTTLETVDPVVLRRAKKFGFSDVQLGHFFKRDFTAVRAYRKKIGINTTYRLVDTC